MKKNLLIACLALSTTSFAQFNDANSPAITNSTLMYVLDTNAGNYAGTTGTGVTWDYTTVMGVPGETKTVEVVAANAGANAADFPTAEIAIEIPGFLTAYNTSSAMNYSSQGFVFTEPSFGEVVAKFDVNDEMLMGYPAAVNSTFSDAVEGEVTTALGSFPCTGTVETTVDGSGTLMLNAATSLTNVLRFRIEDSLYVDAGFLGEVIMKRVQYEYYHHATSNLPVFVHTNISVSISGAPQVTGLVLSAYEPDQYLGINSAELVGVTVYPNPAVDVINFNGLTEDATVEIFSLNGQLVKTVALSYGTKAVSIDDLTQGSYLVKATTSNGTLTTKVAVK
jgi:hypothetical protein